jgi:OOP family OmpA-OmpF porin
MVIQGNADIPGSHETNMTLSKHRAQQIRAWLIARGVAPHRLPTIGYGNTKPATLDRSPTGLELNNRVEFHFDR